MEVNVGQVLYVLNSKSHSLLPAQVDEIVVSKTLRGETTQHILALQNGRKVALEDLKTPWFKELDAAKAFLLSEAEKMIDQIVVSAKASADQNFEKLSEVSAPQALSTVENIPQLPEDVNQVTVDLGDGRKARVSIPEDMSLESTTS